VSNSLEERLERIEILFSEQEYTIQALNQAVAQQDREISRLQRGVEMLDRQLQAIRDEAGDDTDAAAEKPPHY
jgi:uncharacterized coiled-coil protein SlyX